MIDDSEMFSGLSFLMKHSHADYAPALSAAFKACLAVRHQHMLDALREHPVDVLELSVRTANAVMAMGCGTLGHIETMLSRESDEELMARGKRHSFGKKCLKEVRVLLKDMGLK
ncbi:MAG TPA: DNA-directed RNA polymerase subunit alpha C-terminal domain-containing protein [Isosphaeraceae bacterium]|nr:DNA-directed RNA polymerase subunit alpha C-terminal domain-containing protein [Isosphaeraceae bacterium]